MGLRIPGASPVPHIKQIKKYVLCILLCLKINIWDCVGTTPAAFKGPTAEMCVLWPHQPYLSMHKYVYFAR
jgi:hypothetical protein